MTSPGTLVAGRYRLEECVARDVTSDEWRCVDELLGRVVALKILYPSLLGKPGLAERFRAKARALASVDHPGVVVVHEYVIDESAEAYLVLEHIEGEVLRHTLARVGRISTARTMALVAQAADALHAAHAKGLVHGEISPNKLVVRPDDTLVLTGFVFACSPSEITSAAGSVIGDTIYFAPEQALGHQATELSDIFALSLLAYTCLSGQRPFRGDNPLEHAMRLVREPALPLPPDVASNVGAVVERAMAKDPAARWPSAAALAQAARVGMLWSRH